MKKPPIINRGYWARVQRVWNTLEEFMSAEGQKQVISLGAGYDTTFWVMKDKFPSEDFNYIEVDFPQVCRKKISVISKNPQLASKVEVSGQGEIITPSYKLLGQDLRDLQSLDQKLQSLVSKELPTLFIAECVLVYMYPEHSDALLEYSQQFPNCGFLAYDIIGPNDAFGRTMLENLDQRGVRLHGIHKYPSLEDHKARYQAYFSSVQAFTMLEIYNNCLPSTEKSRVEQLEWMDEFEEWNLLLSHYVMVIATNGLVNLKFR